MAATKLGDQPMLILREETAKVNEKGTQHANIIAAKIIVEAVKSSLGCEGHGKT